MSEIGFSRDWCINMAEREGNAEIGAGSLNHPLRAPQPCPTCGDTSPLPECPDCGYLHPTTPARNTSQIGEG